MAAQRTRLERHPFNWIERESELGLGGKTTCKVQRPGALSPVSVLFSSSGFSVYCCVYPLLSAPTDPLRIRSIKCFSIKGGGCCFEVRARRRGEQPLRACQSGQSAAVSRRRESVTRVGSLPIAGASLATLAPPCVCDPSPGVCKSCREIFSPCLASEESASSSVR